MSDLLVRRDVLSKLDGIRKNGAGYTARCPMPDHNDSNASLTINPGQTQLVVMHCHGCQADPRDIAAAAEIPWDLISKPREDRPADDQWMPCIKRDGHQWAAGYTYRDQHGAVVLGVARCTRKCFAQWRPDTAKRNGRAWSLTLPDGTKAGAGILYRLPELLASAPDAVYVVEGEKDAESLHSLGLTGTCNSGGSGKWTPQHAAWLAGRDVIVVADRDAAGQKHALEVVESLMPIALSIDIAQAAEGKDVTDHLNAGFTIDQLARVGTPKPAVMEVQA